MNRQAQVWARTTRENWQMLYVLNYEHNGYSGVWQCFASSDADAHLQFADLFAEWGEVAPTAWISQRWSVES